MNFNNFFYNLLHSTKKYSNYNTALQALQSLCNCIDTVRFDYSITINLNNKFFFKDENNISYFYLFDLPEESDILTNMYTNNKNISMFVNNNGKLILIDSKDMINSFIIKENKISIIIKFNDNIIPENFTLYYTGILLNTKPRKQFINYIVESFNYSKIWLIKLN